MPNNNIISYQSIYSTQIYLNSANAVLNNGTLKSDVQFFIQNVINCKRKSSEMRVSLVNGQFPNSFYQINNSNNTIIINSVIYVFPNGNYNINNFISTWYNIIGNTWILSFSSITNKLTFSFTSSFMITDVFHSLFPVIGLVPGVIYRSVGNSLSAPSCVNFSGLPRLLISSSSFSLNSKTSYDSAMGNIIASVPNNTIQNGIIHYTNYTNYKSIFQNSELSSICIIIQDDFENFIDFNNLDWSLTLQIDIVHEVVENIDTVDDIYETAKNELL